ncbi:MAG: RNA-guided pseudouridylation complex pseudouridine synthase subunit Cbf5 [Candidatus Bathyarchaeia archaeon]
MRDLDWGYPAVTGVLPITLNNAVKIVRVLLSGGKEYVGVMRLHGDVSRDKIKSCFDMFQGEIYQKPPVRSSVKRRLRTRRIYYLELLEIDGRDVLFRVGCEAGTYIRKLCYDIGEILGCGAHMKELRRTRVSTFTEDECVRVDDIFDAYMSWKESGDESMLRRIVRPMEDALTILPQVIVKDTAVEAICNGADLAVPGIVAFTGDIREGSLVAILTVKGEGVALGLAQLSAEKLLEKEKGIAVKTERVLMQPGTYPRVW